MDITPEHLIKLLADVGVPSMMLLGILYVVYRFSDSFAKNFFEHMVSRLDEITKNAHDGVANARANRDTIERCEHKIEAQTQVLTEIKTILINRMDAKPPQS
jgi:hypothetical protein